MARTRRLLAIVILVSWLISLACPVAIIGTSPNEVLFGLNILLMGWMGVLIFHFGWFANIALLVALIIIVAPMRGVAGRESSKIWGWIAFTALIALCGDAALWREVADDRGSARILSFGVGYYLWFGAMFGGAGTLLYSSMSSRLTAPRDETGEPEL
jgi:hypothetical protein